MTFFSWYAGYIFSLAWFEGQCFSTLGYYFVTLTLSCNVKLYLYSTEHYLSCQIVNFFMDFFLLYDIFSGLFFFLSIIMVKWSAKYFSMSYSVTINELSLCPHPHPLFKAFFYQNFSFTLRAGHCTVFSRCLLCESLVSSENLWASEWSI